LGRSARNDGCGGRIRHPGAVNLAGGGFVQPVHRHQRVARMELEAMGVAEAE
jgi:hypothetical protein